MAKAIAGDERGLAGQTSGGALPAVPGTTLPGDVSHVRIRIYSAADAVVVPRGFYLGVVHRGFVPKQLTVTMPRVAWRVTVTDLIGGSQLSTLQSGDGIAFGIQAGAMELGGYLVTPGGRRRA